MEHNGRSKPMRTNWVSKSLIFCGGAICAAFFISVLLMVVALIRAYLIQETGNFRQFTIPSKYLLDDTHHSHYLNLFSESIRFKTVSTSPGKYDKGELSAYQTFLKRKFPNLMSNSLVTLDRVNDYSLLIGIKGSESIADLQPYLISGHLDVVPAPNENEWEHPPFSGNISFDEEKNAELVWGRGAIDVKSIVMGSLSAVDFLFSKGWKPKRSFYIALGHDEEVYGYDGASNIAKLLKKRNVTLEFLLDEGFPLTEGVFPGLDLPLALIGVSEKGRMDVKVTCTGTGGHSSVPPKNQAMNKLINALTAIVSNPLPPAFGHGPEVDMLRSIAPKASWPEKFVYANTWLFGDLITTMMMKKSESAAMITTTSAVTMIQAGVKRNVIPTTVSASVNHRIHPTQTLQEVLEHDKYVIDDPSVQLKITDELDPHPISDYGSNSPYEFLGSVIKHTYPEAVVAPSVLVGNTDSYHYLDVVKNIYRLIPAILNGAEIRSIHSHNEYLSTKNFKGVVTFYRNLILAAEKLR